MHYQAGRLNEPNNEMHYQVGRSNEANNEAHYQAGCDYWSGCGSLLYQVKREIMYFLPNQKLLPLKPEVTSDFQDVTSYYLLTLLRVKAM